MKKSNLKQSLIAFVLCIVMMLTQIPNQVFAWGGDGYTVDTFFGDEIVASDGAVYTNVSPYHAMHYHDDGSTSYHTYDPGKKPRTYYMTRGSDGYTRPVFCVESGKNFGGDSGYVSEEGTNSQYLMLLPYSARYGIMLTTVYGWAPGRSVPVSGCNEADYYVATQILIWEYQQQVRTSTTARKNNGVVDADQYYSSIKGRPAEQIYNWMLTKMGQHNVVPSFTNMDSNLAQTHTLKYNASTQKYSLTLTDTNNLNLDYLVQSASGIAVTRSGNSYTFTSADMITNSVLCEYKKNVGAPDEDMLIWGYPGRQTMLSGVSDPISFFVKFNTETYGKVHLAKEAEDGLVGGIDFRIKGTNVDRIVTTKTDGTFEIDLLPDTYTVTEIPVDKYVTPEAKIVIIQSGRTSTVTFNNILKKGQIKLQKNGEMFASVTEEDGIYTPVYELMALPDAEFNIIADDDIQVGNSVRYSKDDIVETITTDHTGVAISRPLYIGKYRIEEIKAPYGMVINAKLQYIELTYDGQTEEVRQIECTATNERQKVSITLNKVMQRNYLFGIGDNTEYINVTFGLFAAADITALDGSIIPKDGLMEIIAVDEDGSGVFTVDLPIDTEWYVREITTDDHYILSDKKYPVEFAYTGQDEAMVNIIASEKIINKLISGKVEGYKVDENGKPLGTAVIGLFDPVTTEFTKENAILIAETNVNGKWEFSNVPFGKWVVAEIQAPKGYELSQVPVEVDVAEHGVILRISFENKTVVPVEPEEPEKPEEPTKPEESKNPEEPKNTNTPKTGDTSNMTIWLIVLGVAVIAISVILISKVRKNNAKDEGSLID